MNRAPYVSLPGNYFTVIPLACSKGVNQVLTESGVKVTDENKERIDEVIPQYIGEQSRYGRCSADS